MAIIGKTYYGKITRKNVDVVDITRDYSMGRLTEWVHILEVGSSRPRKISSNNFKSAYQLVG